MGTCLNLGGTSTERLEMGTEQVIRRSRDVSYSPELDHTCWHYWGLWGAADRICSSARNWGYLHMQLYASLISLCAAARSPWSRSQHSRNTTSQCACGSVVIMGSRLVEWNWQQSHAQTHNSLVNSEQSPGWWEGKEKHVHPYLL